MDDLMREEFLIRKLVENWVVWRDSGDWERFKTVWHPEGKMMATWKHGTWEEFLQATIDGWKRGVRIVHALNGMSVEIAGSRAVVQTKMSISQRGECEGVLVDVTCIGRFYDFLEKRDGRWGFVLRQPIYEKDRMDPVDPSATLKLDQAKLKSFPEGYCHLAYLQDGVGYKIKMDMPQLIGPEVEALYRRGADWLAGKPL